jgi:CheY-like chemotaxis protein
MRDLQRLPDPRRVLFLARDRADLDELPGRLRALPPPLDTHATRRMGEALVALSRDRFDAAVCSVDAPGDVATVIRFKKAAPSTPVFALSTQENSDMASLSLRMGAAAVLRRDPDPAVVAGILRRALEMRHLAREIRARVGSSWDLAREIRQVSARTRLLATEALSRFTANPADGFEPLLVEDNPDDALFFVRALRKLGLPRRVPVARSAREAIDYLSGRGEFADRVLYPVPSIVVLDFHLGRGTGEEVLRFIRKEPSLERTPVVLLTSSENPAEAARMVDLGVSAHIVKPPIVDDLCAVVRLILDFWQVFRTQSADAWAPPRPLRP